MSNIFFCSDHHFGHSNILTFKDANNNKLRPYSSLLEMHVHIIEQHNLVVKPDDKVYFLGDVLFNKKYEFILSLLNGSKRLVRGNHDVLNTNFYLKYFKEIYGSRYLPEYKIILTHFPVHESTLKPDWINVHGHTHITPINHPQYKCVCLEQINYTPISLESLLNK